MLGVTMISKEEQAETLQHLLDQEQMIKILFCGCPWRTHGVPNFARLSFSHTL